MLKVWKYKPIKVCKYINIGKYLEYRRAWENTLCMGYNIRECRVAVSRLTAQGKNNLYFSVQLINIVKFFRVGKISELWKS